MSCVVSRAAQGTSEEASRSGVLVPDELRAGRTETAPSLLLVSDLQPHQGVGKASVEAVESHLRPRGKLCTAWLLAGLHFWLQLSAGLACHASGPTAGADHEGSLGCSVAHHGRVHARLEAT